VAAKIAKVAGESLSLSNLEKDLYPSYGFTKAHVLEYYRRISRFLLPHLAGRALTMKRYPEGVDEDFFFEKRCPSHRPSWVRTARIPQGDGERMTVCLVNDLKTLMWVANLASLELHVPLAKARSPKTPDAMVFDLDPGDGAGLPECARVALILQDLLLPLHLAGYVKTSGMKGLHVFVPLNRSDVTFEATRAFSKTVAGVLERKYPDLITARLDKRYRAKRVFINWAQNASSKTMVCVYSLRAREKPFVSFPLAWKDLKRFAGPRGPKELQVLHSEAVTRAEKAGDLFRDVLVKKQKLPVM
jgi:bifunctional non-homologous end joining protein LigD